MPLSRRTRLALLALTIALLLACQLGPRPTGPAQPTDTAAPTATARDRAQALPTHKPTATPTQTPIGTPTQTPNATPMPIPSPAPSALPPPPDAGPLPAIWTEIDFGIGGDLNLQHPSDIAVDAASGWAYVLSSCEPESLYEGYAPRSCVSALDLQTGRVLQAAAVPGSGYSGHLLLCGNALYLHHPWSAELHPLDPATLAVSDTITGVYGIACGGHETTYVVTGQGLARLGSDTDARPVARKYDDAPVAMAADAKRVYVLGYDSLQVFDASLELLSTIPLPDGQLRAAALDAGRDRLYVGDYDGLYLLDAATGRFSKTPAPLLNAQGLVLDPAGRHLYAFVRLPGWFSGTQVADVDTETWEVRTLYTTLGGELRAMALDQDRLLIASASDHALIPLDLESGQPAPRLPVGIQVIDAIVDQAADRLYVSDSAGWVHVLDRRTYAESDRAYGGQQISLDAAHGRLYAGDERLPAVTVFDSTTMAVERAIPQPGRPRANPATGEVVIVNRRFYVFDGASGEPGNVLEPGIGVPAEECMDCFYPIGTDVTIDARRGLTMPVTYTPWPGKPGPQESIDYDLVSGRAYYALTTGGYVHYSSIALYPDLEQLRIKAQPILTLEGLSGYIQLDAPARRLYVVRGRFLYVLDSETLQRVGRVDAVDWSPVLAEVDDELGRLYAPHGDKLVVWTRTGGAPPAPLLPEPAVITNTVTAILPSPNFAADHTLLATIDGQLCRSTDGGETWQRLRGGLPELGDYVPTVRAVFSPDYAQDDTIFYSTFLGETYGEGIYRSADGGASWHVSSTGLYDLRVYRIVPSPRYAQDGTLLAYAYTHPGEALYRSTDRGTTWQPVVRQVEYGTPPLPRPEEMFPAAEHLPQFRCDYDGVCERSADGGETWDGLDTAQFHMAHVVDYVLSPAFDRDYTAYLLTQSALFRYNDRTKVGEICTDRPLYGSRDYTNEFADIAIATTDDGTDLLFIGSAGGEFLRYAPDQLSWSVVWPLARKPTPVPSPTPTPCAYEIDGRFDDDYTKEFDRLGCPTGPGTETAAAFQPFELGMMFWRQDQRAIYVLQQDGTWADFEDTWGGTQTDRDPALVPPEGRYQPVRGFGKVWREWLGGPEAWIGWATAEERGGTALAQPCAGGLLFRGIDGVTYALYTDGTWASAP
jgi:hypothetical protein